MKKLFSLVVGVFVAAPFGLGCGSAPSIGTDADAERTMEETMSADTMADAPVETGAAETSP